MPAETVITFFFKRLGFSDTGVFEYRNARLSNLTCIITIILQAYSSWQLTYALIACVTALSFIVNFVNWTFDSTSTKDSHYLMEHENEPDGLQYTDD